MSQVPARNASPQGSSLLDVQQVAVMLACSPRSVFRLADAGRIPFGVKLGAMRRWDARQLEDFISNGCKPVRGKGVQA